MLTRRNAMIGAAALSLPLMLPKETVAALRSDLELLELSRQFWRTLRLHDRVWAEYQRLRADFHDREGTGPDPWAEDYDAQFEKYLATRRRDISSRYFDRACTLTTECGRLANTIFAMPANTPQGLLAKFRILHRATGDYPDAPVYDEALAAVIDEDAPWIRSFGRDLERLAR